MTNENSRMYLGEILFSMFQICGFWRPVNYHSWKMFFYQIYSIFTVTLFFLFTISFNAYVFQYQKTVKDFTQSIFYACTFSLALIKLTVLFRTRATIIKSKEMFLSEICQPRDEIEMSIIRECSHVGR